MNEINLNDLREESIVCGIVLAILFSWTIAHSTVQLFLRFADTFSIWCLYEIAALFWGITFWRVKKLFFVFFLRLSDLHFWVFMSQLSFAKRTPFRLWQKPKMTNDSARLHKSSSTTASVVPLTCCACT